MRAEISFLIEKGFSSQVLILVLMEYARRDHPTGKGELTYCLNPCFNGICAPRLWRYSEFKGERVLILVLMEYARRVPTVVPLLAFSLVLILVLMEYARREANQTVIQSLHRS